MTRRLLLNQVTDRGTETVAALEAGQVVIGREPEGNGIRIESEAISRSHGIFARFRNNWFYKDLGSTNGSWINGDPVPADSWRVVRAGDVVQVATTAIKLDSDGADVGMPTVAGLSALGGRSLVVFSNGEFREEYPIPEYGRALVVGGNQTDLPLEADVYEFPSLVIERRGDNVCAFSVAKEIPFYHNGERASELRVLGDGDALTIGYYQILYSDPRGKRSESSAQYGGAEAAPSAMLRGWGGGNDQGPDLAEGNVVVKKPTLGGGRIQFGQTNFEDRDELPGSVPTAVYNMRGGSVPTQPEDTYTALEDKIIIGVLIIMLVAVLIILVYWAAA